MIIKLSLFYIFRKKKILFILATKFQWLRSWVGVTLLKASPARFVAARLLAQRYDIPFHSCANLNHTVPCPNYPELGHWWLLGGVC